MSPRSIIAVGEVTDLTHPSKPESLPVLATATGEAGELLRLTRLEESSWSWDGRQECTLQLPVVDHDVEVDEVVWSSDGLPITQVQFVTSTTAGSTTRWLLVQKQTSTMMFRPQFSRVPKTKSASYQSAGSTLSRIDPNHILTLSHRQTGGNAHVDLAFNPPVDDRPPQLCVVDECGYWTLWNLSSLRMGRNPGLALIRGGHIWEGPLSAIPKNPSFPAETHGVLFVGTEHDNMLSMSQGALPGKAERSKHILLWNSDFLKIIDTETNIMLPDVPGLTTAKKHHDRIVNVQLSPINQDHIYVLTVRYLILIELGNMKGDKGQFLKPRIRLSCPHLLPGGVHLKLALVPFSTAEGDTPLVCVYSSSHDQISAHWIHLAQDIELPQWHSQLLTMRTRQAQAEPGYSTFRDFVLLPLNVNVLPGATGPGPRYMQQGIHFFQSWIIGHDFGVHNCMCIASTKPEIDVLLPHKRLRWEDRDKSRKAQLRRKNLLRFLDSASVVPDEMTDEAIMSLLPRGQVVDSDEEAPDDEKIDKSAKPIKLDLDRLIRALNGSLDWTSKPEGMSIALLEAVQGVIQQGIASERHPFMTWKELALDHDVDSTAASEPMPPGVIEEAVEEFLAGAGDEAVVVRLTRSQEKEPEQSVGSLSLLEEQLSSIWVEPLKGRGTTTAMQKRSAWVSELARDLFLSTHGVAVQDVPLFGRAPTTIAAEYSQHSLPSTDRAQSSQPSSSIPSPPPSTSGSTASSDEALRRLSLLASNIKPGSNGSSKPAAVLDFWPSQRGVDTEGYVSSVAIASDRKFDHAREKLRQAELSRQKKRAAAEKLKRPAFKRKGFPDSEPDGLPSSPAIRSSQALPVIKSSQAPQIRTSETQPAPSQGPVPAIMSSQGPVLESSQNQPRGGTTMSQVVPGAFGGDRKKAKKNKKKSGFR